jgi:Fe-S cluster assembly protein SufD
VPGELLSPARLDLTRDAVEALARERQEPDWLVAVRVRAFEAFTRLPVPDDRTEGWRRTSLRGLPLGELDLTRSPELTVRGGAGASVLPLTVALADSRLAPRIEAHFARVVAADLDKFVALHYAFGTATRVIVVPRGQAIDEPLWLTWSGDGAALVHTLILAEPESAISIVEEFDGGAQLASGVVEQVIGANAHLRYVQLQRWADDVWAFSTQRAILDRDASLRTLNVVLGGRLSRTSIQTVLEGQAAQVDLLGIAAADGQRHVDFQTLQDHRGNDTRSDLVIHDALRGRSSANFTGLIRINPPAHRTESSQQQKNILLSDRARADSDPKLEILNNDVIRCTHGASVGPVDPESVFYLQSRGLDRHTAERLIVEGFYQSVLRKLDAPSSVETAVWAAVAETAELA